MNYGLPYRGSKNKIAKRIVELLPKATTLVDLFAGGCAITHAAMLSGKYQNYIANDIGDAPTLFASAINGDYNDERRWISREDFSALKDPDPYVRYCWSFGNNGATYMYSKEIAPLFISEYQMPDDFVCVAEIDHTSKASGTGAKRVTERLFALRRQYIQ